MPPRHLHNHPRHSLLLALTNDRQLAKTRHLYWDIWQGHNLCPLKKNIHRYWLLCAPLSSWIESGDFTSTAADLSLLFSFSPGHRWICPVLVSSATQRRPQWRLLLWCCCSGLLFQSPHRDKPRMTTFFKDQMKGNARVEINPLLIAAPQRE